MSLSLLFVSTKRLPEQPPRAPRAARPSNRISLSSEKQLNARLDSPAGLIATGGGCFLFVAQRHRRCQQPDGGASDLGAHTP
jgi:hypothetical protein